jgi:hypothetical protein
MEHRGALGGDEVKFIHCADLHLGTVRFGNDLLLEVKSGTSRLTLEESSDLLLRLHHPPAESKEEGYTGSDGDRSVHDAPQP